MATKLVNINNTLVKNKNLRSPYVAHIIKRNNYGKRPEKSILATAIFERPSQKASEKDEEK